MRSIVYSDHGGSVLEEGRVDKQTAIVGDSRARKMVGERQRENRKTRTHTHKHIPRLHPDRPHQGHIEREGLRCVREVKTQVMLQETSAVVENTKN